MSWYISALIYSFMHTAMALVNQKFKLPGAVLGMWRGFGVFIVLMPFAFFISPPTSLLFYILIGLNGIASGFYDNISFEISSKFSAGGLLRLRPLALIAITIIWWLIRPNDFILIWQNPLLFGGIVSALFLTIVALFFIKKSPVSKELFITFLPLIFLSTITPIINKISMEQGAVESVIFYYIFIQGIINGLTNTCLYLKHPERKTFPSLFSKKVIHAGTSIIFILIALLVTKNYSMKFTPNPAYVQAISYLSAVWATGLNWIRGFKDKSNIWAEFLLIISAIGLIFLTKL